jgi:hypothetical protein
LFDTLLAVYTGTSVTNLTLIASDEDLGGYFTSEFRFNARAGVDYHIEIDGYFGIAGEFLLSWELEATSEKLPVIRTQPVSQVISSNGAVTFAIQAEGSDLRYQWLFEKAIIPGANDTSYTITSVQRAHVGNYSILVANSDQRTIESLPAALELGAPGPISQYKLEDLVLGPGSATRAAFAQSRLSSVSPLPGFISVSAGSIESRLFENRTGTTQAQEPVACDTIGGASKWLPFKAEQDGVLVIDTIGSEIDTILTKDFTQGHSHLVTNPATTDLYVHPGGVLLPSVVHLLSSCC